MVINNRAQRGERNRYINAEFKAENIYASNNKDRREMWASAGKREREKLTYMTKISVN
jgi:hypothetical protein